MTHDPKLVDELIAAVDKLIGGSPDYRYKSIWEARNALRPAPPKPREWWVNVYETEYNHDVLHRTILDAEAGLLPNGETVHVREVITNDDNPKVWMPEWDDLPKNENGFFTYPSYSFDVCLDQRGFNAIRNKLMGLKP